MRRSRKPAEHAPRCLDQWVAQPTADPGILLDAVVDEWPNRFFSIGCRCDSAWFAVRSLFWPNSFSGVIETLPPETAYGPITLQCAGCGREHGCFDPAVHGMDAELGLFSPKPPRATDTPRLFGCPDCLAQTFALTARFQYPVLEREHLRYRPGPASAASKDLFSFFTLIGTCTGCRRTLTISSVECA